MDVPADPALQRRCPECGAAFAAPDVREVPGDLRLLDHHCPRCGYHFARWPKATDRLAPD